MTAFYSAFNIQASLKRIECIIEFRMRFAFLIVTVLVAASAFGQSGRTKNYSESKSNISPTEQPVRGDDKPIQTAPDDVIRVETDLVTIPVRITHRNGRPVPDVRKDEFKIFENGTEQEITYFSNEDQPFTVALLLDTSYSTVFKIDEIRSAAMSFVRQLRDQDKVMVVGFNEKATLLCKPTNDRKVLKLAIDGAKIGSGTSVFSALDEVINEQFKSVEGRKAIVILSDGVDTSSKSATAAKIEDDLLESDILIYPIQYNTFDDVQKNRRNNAEIRYDDNDRPYVVEAAPVRGERMTDYSEAREFFKAIADSTGGRVYKVNSTTNLDRSFADIANQLRRIYSLGYYPGGERSSGAEYNIRVRVYRPGLVIHARSKYVRGQTSRIK